MMKVLIFCCFFFVKGKGGNHSFMDCWFCFFWSRNTSKLMNFWNES